MKYTKTYKDLELGWPHNYYGGEKVKDTITTKEEFIFTLKHLEKTVITQMTNNHEMKNHKNYIAQ